MTRNKILRICRLKNWGMFQNCKMKIFYISATSTGQMEGLKNRVGGLCKTRNMRIHFVVREKPTKGNFAVVREKLELIMQLQKKKFCIAVANNRRTSNRIQIPEFKPLRLHLTLIRRSSCRICRITPRYWSYFLDLNGFVPERR